LYGTQLDEIVALGDVAPEWLSPLGPGIPAVRAEAKLAAEREIALGLIDFMDRRSALLLFSPDFGLAAAPEACSILGDVLGWDAERRAADIAAYLGARGRTSRACSITPANQALAVPIGGETLTQGLLVELAGGRSR
jgi:glycerol-3-phosphate dehydrogenase